MSVALTSKVAVFKVVIEPDAKRLSTRVSVKNNDEEPSTGYLYHDLKDLKLYLLPVNVASEPSEPLSSTLLVPLLA